MNSGNVSAWRSIWSAPVPTHAQITDEKFKDIWQRMLDKPHFILYELEYKDHVVFVTEREGGGQGARGKFFFKKVGDRFLMSPDLFGDPFASILDSPTFDPSTGVRKVEPVALYQFEELEPKIEVKDTATIPLLGTDHSINYGYGKNLETAPGVKGKALVLNGTGYVEFPPSVPLSLYNNRFTLSVWVKPSGVPEQKDNEISEGLFAATILSRSKPDRRGLLAR